MNSDGEACTMKDLDYAVLSTKSYEEAANSMPPSVENETESTVQCLSRDFDPNYDTIVTTVIF